MAIEEWSFVERLTGKEGSLRKAIDERREEIQQLEELKEQRYQKGYGIDSVQRLLRTFTEEKTINFLASSGIIPKYGFPIDVVQLRVLNQNSISAKVDLSRDLKLAISEFSLPGNVVANGKIWQSKYLNTVPNRTWPVYRYYHCPKCSHISPTNEATPLGQSYEEEIKNCPYCSNTMTPKNSLYLYMDFRLRLRIHLLA